MPRNPGLSLTYQTKHMNSTISPAKQIVKSVVSVLKARGWDFLDYMSVHCRLAKMAENGVIISRSQAVAAISNVTNKDWEWCETLADECLAEYASM